MRPRAESRPLIEHPRVHGGGCRPGGAASPAALTLTATPRVAGRVLESTSPPEAPTSPEPAETGVAN